MKSHTGPLLLLTAFVIHGNVDALGQKSWVKYPGNPVMQVGQGVSWDHGQIYPGPVLFRDSVYHLWYIGWDGTDNWRYFRSGYAHSPNGITWTKQATPVLDVGALGAWDALDAEAGAVLYDGGTFKMWYNGYATSAFYQQVGYATGVNESTWTKRATPVLSGSSSSWDAAGVMYTSVHRSSPSGGFKMWYSGWDGSKLVDGYLSHFQIGYATATNETTWTKHPSNPVLTLGSPGQWDDLRVQLPMVVFDSSNNRYCMFYGGANMATEIQRIGLATSPDGVVWTKYSKNPILDIGPSGSWDAKNIVIGGVVIVRDTFRMWYTGMDVNNVTRIGYAWSPRIIEGVAEGNEGLPQSCMLMQNYPNPFNPSTTIRYGLPARSNITLTVFNTLGQQVATLVDGVQEAGFHEVQFHGSGLASGVYFYRLRAGDYVDTRKLLLLR